IEASQAALRKTSVRRSQIIAAVSRSPEDRQAVFEQLSAGVEGRAELLQKVAEAYDALQMARSEYDARRADEEQTNLTRNEVEAWVRLPAQERDAQRDTLVRDVPGRETLLNAAATAWDNFQAAVATAEADPDAEAPTTQPGEARALESAYDRAVTTVLRTNINVDAAADGVNIDTVIASEEAFDAAVGDVLATNVDMGDRRSVV